MDLLQNPFRILTASPRDNRRRIMELADERSLLLDSNECIEARSDLTNPRKRLSAEVAWLPGIGPKRAGEVLSLLESSPRDLLAIVELSSIVAIDELSSVARANLLVSALARLTGHSADELAKWVLEIAGAFEDIDPEELSVIINEERVVSGFPEVSDLSAVENEIQERRGHYRNTIKSALDNNLDSKELVEAVTVVVESATNDGEIQGPILIADLVDSYEVEAQGFLDKEERNINILVKNLRKAVDAERPDSTLAPMVNQLVQVVKDWDTVAQPIQVSAKSRGLDHDASHRIAMQARRLAINMLNKHGKLDFAQQITSMLQEVFAEVGEVAERTSKDVDVLENIVEERARSKPKPKRSMDLLQNPFRILTASPRDNRRRIMELADERSLLLDSNECIEARSDLTNPRKRLSAEVAWLPGIGPKRAGEVLSLLESSPKDLLAIDDLSSIARANLLVSALVRLPGHSADELAKWILEIAGAFEDIDPEELSVLINEERVVSGFPEVSDLSAVEDEIQERRRHYRNTIKSALDNLDPEELVEAVTVAVESATNDGEIQGPILIADLVDSYEVEKQESLDKEEGNIEILVKKLRKAVDAERPDSTLAPMVNQLIQVVKDWDTVAQPIQVSAKSRGLDHDASHRIAKLVRGLAINMFNKHDKLDFAQQITSMLQEVFAEVGEVAERTSKDVDALDDIVEERARSTPKQPTQPQWETASPESKRKAQWVLGFFAVVVVIGLGYSQISPAPTAQTPSSTQSTGLQYTKPSVGSNNELSVPEIRWCIRGGIRIEAMRSVVDTNEGIDEFNRIVNDYNIRCVR